MNALEAFYGPNAGYALELYERYRQDPESVDPATRAFFERGGFDDQLLTNGNRQPAVRDWQPTTDAQRATGDQPAATRSSLSWEATQTPEMVGRIVRAARLARGIREYGHLDAHIDPLGTSGPGDPMLACETHGLTDEDLQSLPASIVFPSAGPQDGTCLDAIRRLREIYCGPLGYEIDQVQDFEERGWLYTHIEEGVYRTALTPEAKKGLLERLTEVESFESFLHRVFQGQKRFSIEGNDMLVPMLDETMRHAAATGVREILIGMAHRGRLNVLAHILGKPYAAIMSEFQTAAKQEAAPDAEYLEEWEGGGDVKYHLGEMRTINSAHGASMQVTLAHNPSHLEYVNPVVEGFARASQDDRGNPGEPVQNVDAALAVAIHGDAAFPGEGIVAETLNLSRLPGYQTGGSLHVIVNNQVGFTTGPASARSTLYASDLAKGFEIPIVHVNADDPEACLAALRLAYAYRDRFNKDFLIDLIGYRRWGHNESDEPAFTQPLLYEKIRSHSTVRALYAEQLEREGVILPGEADAMLRTVQERLAAARDEAEGHGSIAVREEIEDENGVPEADTAVSVGALRALNESLLARPSGFHGNPRVERVLERRREGLERPGGIDWAHAEALAFASILADGTPIRLSGQDSQRGTFSQRHLVLHDGETGDVYGTLAQLPQARASFAVYDSPLTEAAVVGFEYGYSVHAPECLVLWEAQYGDFANAAQVLIDQFVSSARVKWHQLPSLGLLLPHGYEGQGPEHSSARLERYLQLAAAGNMVVVNCTTAAQYFHILRRQAALLDTYPRPFVLMTPKSLLRHPRAGSSLSDLTEGRFQPVLDDPRSDEGTGAVERVILCSGKVAIDLLTNTTPGPPDWAAVVRVEQLYPFPSTQLRDVFRRYPRLREVVWAQEEPRNMGTWGFVAPRLQELLPQGIPLRYVGRADRASTAAGSPIVHAREQATIIEEALGGERPPEEPVHIETRGKQYVG